MSKLAVSLDVPFGEAIAWAGKRSVILPDEFYADVQAAARKGAFTVSGITSLGGINRVLDSLNDAIREGKSMRDWNKSLDPDLLRLKPFLRETIFRNAVQSAYAAGRWQQQQRVKAIRPILMYDAINDSRTRPTHRALDSFMAPVDDPVWKRIYPPNGHNCRCTVVSLTEKQARARGWTGFVKALPAEPDDGWDHNPGLAQQEALDRARNDEIMKAPLQVVRAQQAKEMLQAARVQAKDYVLGKPDSDRREYGIAINPQSGLADGIFTGEKNYIALPRTDANIRALTGSIFFHNHPSSSSFSVADFGVAALYRMREVHAVGADGSWFMGRAPKLSEAEALEYGAALKKVSYEAGEALFAVLRPLFNAGKIDASAASKLHAHLTNEALAAAGLVKYEVLQTGQELGSAITEASMLLDVGALKRRVIAVAKQQKVKKYAIDD